MSLLNKLKEGKLDSINPLKLQNSQRGNGSISRNVILLFDKMHLQNCTKYSGGELIGKNSEKEIYKSVVFFMIEDLE